MDYLEPDLLRTFLAIADTGSLARAATIVGRSASAVTAQMQRLEQDVGDLLLAPAGRGRVLTRVGEELVGHARHILAAHRQALLSLRGARAAGHLSIGVTQDFSESGLPDALRLFANSHPHVRLGVRVGRSLELSQAFDAGEADIALTMRMDANSKDHAVISEPMVWFGPSAGLVNKAEALPLALLDPPCGFRSAVLMALEEQDRPYSIMATSQSLSGLKTAVSAGLALTARTARWRGNNIGAADAALDLPALPEAVFSLRLKAGATPAARELADLLAETLTLSRR